MGGEEAKRERGVSGVKRQRADEEEWIGGCRRKTEGGEEEKIQ